MKNFSLKCFLFSTVIFAFLFAAHPLFAQNAVKPEFSVAGFRLGEETANKEKLKGYSPRYDNETGQPKYFFYNEYGNQVLEITCLSKERPFLIVGIEVFAVGESYQKKHYQLKEVGSFVSEAGFYIGEKPSATSLIFAVPNVIGAKDVIKKVGTPDSELKEDENKVRILNYQSSQAPELKNLEEMNTEVNFNRYTAKYRFVKNRLRRFSIALETAQTAKN